MRKYGFLNEKQVAEYARFLYKDDEPNITDYAISMGSYVDQARGIHGLIAYNQNLEGKKFSEINKLTFSEKTVFNKDKNFKIDETNPLMNTHLLYIPWLSSDPILSWINGLQKKERNPLKILKKTDDRYFYISFGYFPQTVLRKNEDREKYIDLVMKQSGKMFCHPWIKSNDLCYDFTERFMPIYLLPSSEKYIINKVRCPYVNMTKKFPSESTLFKEKIDINYHDYYEFKLEPIKWIVDQKNHIMFPDKGLFSGFSLCGYDSFKCFNTFDMESSPVYKYLENFFLPNIIEDKELLSEIICNKYEIDTNKYEQKIIEKAKETGKEKLYEFYSQIESEMLEKLFGDNIRELSSLSNEVIKKVSKELHTIVEESFKEQNASFDEELTKVSTELSNKIELLKKTIESKDGVIEYVDKELEDLTQSHISLLDDKLKQLLSLLENSKDDIVLKISEYIKEQLTTFVSDIDKLKNNVNVEISKLERKKQELNAAVEDVDRKIDDIERKITDEVIRQVVESNPVKEVNVTINDVKKKGIKGLFHQDFEAILQLVSLKMPIFLVGPAGCGKNVILKQCSEVLGKKFYYQNDADEDYKLLGFIDANGIYHKTPFYDAFKNGGILMLDEMDNSNASVLLKLNSAIGSGNDFYMTFPNGETLNAHKDFQVVAAANTFGTGADQIYCGRNQIDGATLDRYFVYNLDYDKNLERALVKNKEILNVFWEVRKIINQNDIRHTVSTRAILNMNQIISSKIVGTGSFTIGDAFDGTLIKGLDIDDLNIIVSRLSTTDKYSLDLLRHLKRKYGCFKNEYQENDVNNDYAYQYSRRGW